MSDVKARDRLPNDNHSHGGSISMHQVNKDKRLAQMFVSRTAHKLWQSLPSGIWIGRRCFIIGGGPSLKGFDFNQLKGELVITVNRGFESYPDAVLNLAQDARLWGWYENGDLGAEAKKKFETYKGYRTWLNVQAFPYPEDISVVEICHSSDFKFNNYVGGIPPHGNTGLNALCLAACLGASEIYLLGFDCKGINGRTANFHAGYPDSADESIYKNFIDEFKEVAHLIRHRSKVINLNPNSGIRCFEFAEFKDLPKINRPIVVSFFTKGTGYEKEIKRLEESCHKFGLEYDFLGVENLGTWRKNIHSRIKILLGFLDKHTGRDILYIDADGAILNYPVLFDNFQEDFGAVEIDRQRYFPGTWNKSIWSEAIRGKFEILGGTMYFKNNKNARAMLEEWEKLDAPMDTVLSQVHLQKAIDSVPGFKFKKLPDNYCQIFDIMASAGEPVIEHYQASRRGLLTTKL